MSITNRPDPCGHLHERISQRHFGGMETDEPSIPQKMLRLDGPDRFVLHNISSHAFHHTGNTTPAYSPPRFDKQYFWDRKRSQCPFIRSRTPHRVTRHHDRDCLSFVGLRPAPRAPAIRTARYFFFLAPREPTRSRSADPADDPTGAALAVSLEPCTTCCNPPLLKLPTAGFWAGKFSVPSVVALSSLGETRYFKRPA